MTVDPSVLVRNLVWVNIARDLLFDVQGRLSSKYSYAVSFAAEQTQGNRFFGDVKARICFKFANGQAKDGFFISRQNNGKPPIEPCPFGGL